MTRAISINGLGCCLADFIYTNADFSSPKFAHYLSRTEGDGGLSPGRLVFTEDLEHFAHEDFSTIKRQLFGHNAPYAVNIGGPAIVALIGAAQLLHNRSATVKFFGIGGTDEAGDFLMSNIARTPVDMSNFVRANGASPCTTVLSDPSFDHGHGERCFINSIGTAGLFDVINVPDAFFESNIVLLGATALVPRIHAHLGLLLARAKKNNCITVVSTVYDCISQKRAPHQRWPLGESDECYASIDILITDHEESLRLSGASTPHNAMAFFIDHGVSSVFITHGVYPAHVFSNGRLFSAQANTTFPVSALVGKTLLQSPQRTGDTTGCGDNFAGGVLAYLALQMENSPVGALDIAEACSWGMICGGYSCFHKGGVFIESNPGEKRGLLLPYYRDYQEQLAQYRTGIPE